MRIHPAIIAQAAATAADIMPGRFFLGVGTGDNLNEHIPGHRWPPYTIRLEMLKEAVEVMRGLWAGEGFSHSGKYFMVENAGSTVTGLPGTEMLRFINRQRLSIRISELRRGFQASLNEA